MSTVDRHEPRALSSADAEALERCIADGGVALFPADTVYGLACDPESAAAIAALYALKGRPEEKPSAILYGSVRAAAPTLATLRPRTAAAARALLPGPVTLLLPNPNRLHRRVCDPAGADPDAPLGVRVPSWPRRLAALAALRLPIMQSSANLSGQPPALAFSAVEPSIRQGVDVALDGGRLPGIASTVIDLRRFEQDRDWTLVRAGALPEDAVATALERAGV
ncbi:MAG: L-threonylcarbamoyladenylate synthase [Solirubrobacteraceae bacterium]